MEGRIYFRLMFIFVTVLLLYGVTAEGAGCGHCGRNERCIRGRCRPRITESSISQSMFQQNLPPELLPQIIPPGIMIQAAQLGIHQQDLYPDIMGLAGMSGRRPLIVRGHPSLLSQLSALPLLSPESVGLGRRDEAEDSSIRPRISNRRRQRQRAIIIDESDFAAAPLAGHENTVTATEIRASPSTTLSTQTADAIITNEDEADSILPGTSDAAPLHDHTSNPDKHFHFEDAWAYPWRSDDSTDHESTDQAITEVNPEEDAVDVLTIGRAEEESEEEKNADLLTDNINMLSAADERDITVDAEDDDVSVDDIGRNTDRTEDDINGDHDDDAANRDVSNDVIESADSKVDSGVDRQEESDFDVIQSAERDIDIDDFVSEQTDHDTENGDTESMESESEKSVVDQRDEIVDTESNSDDLFDTWAENDYENMRSVVLNKADEPTEIVKTNEANSVSSLNGEQEHDKDEEDEKNDASLYAFASVPVALIIVAIGVGFLCCYWTRIKSRLRKRNQGQSQWMNSNITADNQARKGSSSSCKSLISTRPNGKMSVVSICDTITEEAEVHSVASLAGKTVALENTYVDLDEARREEPAVPTTKETELETTKGVSDHEYAEIGNVSRLPLSRQRTISASSEQTYIESIDNLEPPSYNEVVYDINPSWTMK